MLDPRGSYSRVQGFPRPPSTRHAPLGGQQRRCQGRGPAARRLASPRRRRYAPVPGGGSSADAFPTLGSVPPAGGSAFCYGFAGSVLGA